MIRKEEKGSVTLFVLIACMFMIMVLLMINIAVMNRNRSQERELEEIAKEYNQNETDLDNAYAKVVGENEYVTAKDVQEMINENLLKEYPIGSIYISTNSQNPSEYIGGEWENFGQGKTLVGIDSSDSDFSPVEKTGGQKQIKLKTGNLPARAAVSTEMTRHVGNLSGIKWGNIVVNAGEFALSSVYDLNTVGENIQYETPISILQPYVVTYMWKRVS